MSILPELLASLDYCPADRNPGIVPKAGDRICHYVLLADPTEPIKFMGFQRIVKVQCDCGAINIMFLGDIKGRLTEKCRECVPVKIDKSRSRLHSIWSGMRSRCKATRGASYADYGARGITVCDEWDKSFSAFADWANANGYNDKLTLDRTDNNKGYSPANCAWRTYTEQARNTRRNRIITAFGETKCLTDWGEDERCQVTTSTLKQRIKLGWDTETAITLPSNRMNMRETHANEKRTFLMLNAFGEVKSASEWTRDERCVVPLDVICRRVKSGWTGEDAIATIANRNLRGDTRSLARVAAKIMTERGWQEVRFTDIDNINEIYSRCTNNQLRSSSDRDRQLAVCCSLEKSPLFTKTMVHDSRAINRKPVRCFTLK